MKALIVGAGSHGKVVLEILRERGVSVLGWLDDNPATWGRRVQGLEVLGDCTRLQDHSRDEVAAIVAIGANDVRVRIGEALLAGGVRLLSAIHPSAIVMRSATVGRGSSICAGAIVGVDT